MFADKARRTPGTHVSRAQVFFRKHTQAEAQRLGLHGWCENTARGTVQGELEGPPEEVRQMKTWLRTTGSPKSVWLGGGWGVVVGGTAWERRATSSSVRWLDG